MNLIERYINYKNDVNYGGERHIWNNLLNYTIDKTYGFDDKEKSTVGLTFKIKTESEIKEIISYFSLRQEDDINILANVPFVLTDAYIAHTQIDSTTLLTDIILIILLIGKDIIYERGY